MGRRRRRLPGRQLPAAVDGVERQVPRHRPRLLARRAGDARRVRLPAHRVGRPLRARRPPAGRVDQLRHRPRRLHAARPRLLQREAQRGQRRGQQRRREPQPVVELRRRGADRRPGDQRPARRASSATSSPRCCCRRACRCCSHGDELGRTQQGNNNAYCQDNELSWIDWDAAPTRPLLEFTALGVRAARRAPGVPPPAVLRRPAGAATRQATALPDIAWFAPDGTEMTDEDWDAGFAKSVGVFLNGDGIPDRDDRGPAGHRRLVPAVLQRPLRGDRVHAARRTNSARGGNR